MARITAGLTTSHIPAIGAAIDLGKTEEPYWKPLFAGYEWTKAWAADHRPDPISPDSLSPDPISSAPIRPEPIRPGAATERRSQRE